MVESAISWANSTSLVAALLKIRPVKFSISHDLLQTAKSQTLFASFLFLRTTTSIIVRLDTQRVKSTLP